MSSVNKAIILGNLGKDPESKELQNGCVTSFPVATSESWKDKQTGQKQERTEWHNIVCYNKLAEIARDYLRKGSKVYIEGQIKTEKWTDKNGMERYTTKIVARDFRMLDSKSDMQETQKPTQANQANQANQGQASSWDNDNGDDVPF